MSEPTKETFLKDVKDHELTILKDDGLYRHLQFRKPGTYCMGFDIVTYPGYLVYSGDMGCYVFSRITDMFDFFRSDKDEDVLYINPSYWSEKVQAEDKYDGISEFSRDTFIKNIHDYMDSHKFPKEIREIVESDIIDKCEDFGEQELYRAAYDFDYDNFRFNFRFTDFFEYDSTEWTYRYLWCCYALVWAINQYDKMKEKE